MIIVIMIISIVSSVVIPRLNPDNNFKTLLYVDDLFSTIRYARKRAIAANCPVVVDVNTGQVQVGMVVGCVIDNMATLGSQNMSEPVDNLDVGWKDNRGTSRISEDSNASIRFIFDSRGKAHSATAPYNVIDISLPIGGKTIRVVGETGFIYFGSASA